MVSLSEERVRELWSRYKKQGDFSARERLILAYAPLVKYVASNIGSRLPPHVDQSDLVSYGLLGLAGAIHHFEPESGIGFESYAIPRIRRTILDELRSLDWLPRSVRDLAREIERAIAQLEQRLGHAPADAEIAGELGISPDEFEQRLTQIGRSSLRANAILRLRAQDLFPRPLRAASPVAMPGLTRDADRGWRQTLNRLAAAIAESDDQTDWRS